MSVVSSSASADPYAPRPTVWQRQPELGWALAVAVLTVGLTYAAFPPVNVGEAGYALALPAALWAYRKPSWRVFAWTVLGAQAIAWTLVLGWLYHVTWAGLLILGPFIGLLTGLWHLAARWTLPRLSGQQPGWRFAGVFGLAGWWVVLEWVRGWIFGGFPWLPLAASQWERPLVLQIASWAGAASVTFVLVLFNLGAAAYAHRIFFEGHTGLRKRSPEFMVALMVLVFTSFPFLGAMMGAQRHTLARLALVQPYIAQSDKWDSAKAGEVVGTLNMLTQAAVEVGEPDAVLWPEAVMPWPLHLDPGVQPWLESLAKQTGRPLLLGTVYTEGTEAEPIWRNGAVVVDPSAGLREPPYAKRKLVPFGEYVPLRPLFGWVEKFAPIGGDFAPGASAAPLRLPVRGEEVPVGVLVCYEDIFPGLARDSVRAGAELLAVLTNNAWYGEGGAAAQHATHSVLRAVENRRPLVRVGNGGWSGWVDEFGHIRANLRDERDSVYFRGQETVTVKRDLRWVGHESFYTQHGDWFVWVSAALAALGALAIAWLKPVRGTQPE